MGLLRKHGTIWPDYKSSGISGSTGIEAVNSYLLRFGQKLSSPVLVVLIIHGFNKRNGAR